MSVTSTSNGSIYLEVPYLNISSNESISQGSNPIYLNTSLHEVGEYSDTRGVYIYSDVDVAVYVTNFLSSSTDTYLALPLEMLGTHYTVMSYTPQDDNFDKSEFLVLGAHDDTIVTVKYLNGSTIEVRLDRLDVFQDADFMDLSGTTVSATKPVSVIAGATCTGVNGRFCDMVATELLPHQHLGTNYIIPSAFHSKEFLLRAVPVSNVTDSLELCRDTEPDLYNTIAAGSVIDLNDLIKPATVIATLPVMVVQFINTDSFMTLIPSIDQYTNEYSLTVPEVYAEFSNYIAVVVPDAAKDGILINGAVPTSLNSTYTVAVPYQNYTMLVYDIDIGYQYLNHTDGANFHVSVFGFFMNGRYGFSAGLTLDN